MYILDKKNYNSIQRQVKDSNKQRNKQINTFCKPIKKELNTIMSNSFGFGGTNSNLIINKYES